MSSKHNRIIHHYIYFQDIVLNGTFLGLRSLRSGNLYELGGGGGGYGFRLNRSLRFKNSLKW